MNTAEIIESKQKLEENIKSLLWNFKMEHGLSDVEIDVMTRNIYMDGSVKSFCTTLDVVVTAKANESGVEITIK